MCRSAVAVISAVAVAVPRYSPPRRALTLIIERLILKRIDRLLRVELRPPKIRRLTAQPVVQRRRR